MKKFIAICLAVLLAFAFVSCDVNTKVPPVNSEFADPNVPPEEDFVNEMSQDNKVKVKNIIGKANNSNIQVEERSYGTYTCQEGANYNGEALSGSMDFLSVLDDKGVETITYSNVAITAGEVAYTSSNFKVTKTPKKDSLYEYDYKYEGELLANGSAVGLETAYGMISTLIHLQNVKENAVKTTINKEGETFNSTRIVVSEKMNHNVQEEYYITANLGEDKITVGYDIKEGENLPIFRYLSLNGTYYSKSVFMEILMSTLG